MSKIKSLVPNLVNNKWKQYALVAIGGIGLFTAAYLFTSDDTSVATTVAKDNKNSTTSTMMAAGQQIDPKGIWVGKAGVDVAQVMATNSTLLEADKDKTARLAKLEEFMGQLGKTAAPLAPPLATLFVPPAYPQGTPPTASVTLPPTISGANVQGTQSNPLSGQTTPFQTSPINGGGGLANNNQNRISNSNSNSFNNGRFESVESPIGRITLKAPNVANSETAMMGSNSTSGTGGSDGLSSTGAAPNQQASALKQNAPVGVIKQAGASYLPIGFVKVRILGGLDAPTNGQAQNEPLPLILEVMDSAILPNQFRANTKQCLLVGQAWGDISSERAYGRITTLSCIRHDGTVLEVAANGSVYGEDGKYGIRGTLVSKQGQILANALFAGVISGIGQGIQFRSTSNTVTPLGSTISTPNQNQGFEAGFGGGLGKALDRLAGYYVQLAEKTFPVIEIAAGRIVDVAFTKGIALDVPLPDEYPMAARNRGGVLRGATSDLN
jgi:conjugal transfer pilus assembly protein TraB